MEQENHAIFPVQDALEMVLIFDGTGTISYANAVAERKLEYEGGLCGRSIGDVFPNEFRSADGTFEMSRTFGQDIQNLVAYRQNRTCFPAGVRMLESDIQPGIYICMIDDMLERDYLNREIEKVRQEAEQAMKVKSEFVANVTHELRTPVNGVLGNVRDLLEEEQDAQKRKPLKIIERCCEDMHKIINNILDFSKLEAGKFTLEPRRFHFRDMLNHVKASHSGKITEKGLEFFMTVSPQIPEYVVGDELRIKQVLNNLLSNALKFTAAGKVTVEILKTAQVKDRIELFFIVIDSGIGIAEADQDKLFQSFSQVDASISRKYGGTGLGLNICKQLVELMGGRIGVESQKGKGSTFSFSIWVGIGEPEEKEVKDIPGEPEQTVRETTDLPAAVPTSAPVQLPDAPSKEEQEEILQRYRSPENREALNRNLTKLILCVEMENWEKAEMFMETIRQLTEGAPREVSRSVLKMKMAVQKENYDKVAAEYESLRAFLQSKEAWE
ncbi:MAG: ATP-binding protein [Clostridium sp.]|nr:ATP-binding protein [Acetatifactor muris]MCM1526931.1 ATP-binding protein [Bacteroides sp.]MCM1563275.1 ATP-binding protein [Clostridium sp.]